MAITTHQTSGLSSGVTTARSTTVSAHASVATGDLLYLVCSIADNSSAAVSAVGWTKPFDSASVGTGKLQILSRVRQAGDTSYTLDMIGTNDVRWALVVVSGWDSAVTPIIGSIGTRAASGGTNLLTIPAITTRGTNWTVLACAYERTNGNDVTPTVDNGMSVLVDVHTIAADSSQSVTVLQKIQPTASSTGSTTLTYTNTSALNAAGVHIAIAPVDGSIPVNRVNYVEDHFTRTVAAGNWGAPDTGPTWVVDSNVPSVVSVNGSRGVITPNAGYGARLRAPISPAQTNLQIEGEFYIDKIPITNNLGIRMYMRYVEGVSDYHARIIIAPSGNADLYIARADAAYVGSLYNIGTLTANTVYKFKASAMSVSPTELKAKVWDASTIEPAWQLSRTDSTAGLQVAGIAGIRPNVTSGVTNGPIAFAFDNVIVSNGIEPVLSGRIGLHTSLNPSSDSITVGFDKLGGSAIQIALCDTSDLELTRTNVTNDPTTGWGSARFDGLTPNTIYRVKFYVDSQLQTDASLEIRTLPTGVASYVAVGGSCQFTGSNHPVFDVIGADNPVFVAHMGDLHYVDATTEPAWRAGMESSLTTVKMKSLLEKTSLNWSMDNHDRIIMNPGGAGSALNYGTTNPLTMSEWKQLAGLTGWATADTLGRTWVAGRVRYIQLDMWTLRQDPDFDTGTLTFLGADQKAWFKDTLEAATEPLIVWFCNWTSQNYTNGRWNSFPVETTELENWINARPAIKRRMVLIGGDSHSLQADSGTRTGTFRFKGIPSLNISGFNRSGDAGDGGSYDILDAPLRTSGQLESQWGGYSRITITDNGTELRFKWEGVRVDSTGASDVMAYFERSYGQPFDDAKSGSNQVDSIYIGNTKVWAKDVKGSNL